MVVSILAWAFFFLGASNRWAARAETPKNLCPPRYAGLEPGAVPNGGAGFLGAELPPLRLSAEDRARADRIQTFLQRERRLPSENHPGERVIHNEIDLGLRTAALFLSGLDEGARAVLREAPLYRRLRGRFQRDLRDFLEQGPGAEARPGLRLKYEFWRHLGERFDSSGQIVGDAAEAPPLAPGEKKWRVDAVNGRVSGAEAHARAVAINEFVALHGILPTTKSGPLYNYITNGFKQGAAYLGELNDRARELLRASPVYAREKEQFESDLAFYRRVKPGQPLRPDLARRRSLWEALEGTPF